jgi:hypothetical protein
MSKGRNVIMLIGEIMKEIRNLFLGSILVRIWMKCGGKGLI